MCEEGREIMHTWIIIRSIDGRKGVYSAGQHNSTIFFSKISMMYFCSRSPKRHFSKMSLKKVHPNSNLVHVIWKYHQSTHFDYLSPILVFNWAGNMCEGTRKPHDRGSGDPARGGVARDMMKITIKITQKHLLHASKLQQSTK